ncbi:MAG: 3',5'-cyclic-nucleotide phosphodiesterase, partial [Burkholderiaceae bacterium]|nr:3',5'-cyclic-nucleotide phosphodiesterase [Burkholderiaceae bacterium]
TAFGDDERELAGISGHMCPALLGRELARLPAATDVYITHIKPGETEAVMAEVSALNGVHRLSALRSGQVLTLAD